MEKFLAASGSAARMRRCVMLVLAALVGSSMMIGTASAMPNNEAPASSQQKANGLQPVRWVCGPYRCWWGPGLYWGGPYWRGRYWGPRPYYWDWRGRWHY